jgi:Fur family ferric uptake transcriptional regulator
MGGQREAELSRRLREHGLRATRPRIDVLAALEDLGEHRSADEVRDRATDRGSPNACGPRKLGRAV